jgi:putative MFS transporter
MTAKQRAAAWLVALGEFIDGYDLLVMGTALIYLRPHFGLTPQATGLLGASTFVGAIVGLVVVGDMSDRLSRRSIFVANLFFFVVFSIAFAFIVSRQPMFRTGNLAIDIVSGETV